MSQVWDGPANFSLSSHHSVASLDYQKMKI